MAWLAQPTWLAQPSWRQLTVLVDWHVIDTLCNHAIEAGHNSHCTVVLALLHRALRG
jgi:hypothetical protein